MTRLSAQLMLLSTCLFVAPAVAQPASSVATTADRIQLALELVKLTYPAERAKSASLTSYEQNFRASFLANPQNVKVAARHPGLVDAMAAAGRDEMAKITNEIEPRIFEVIARSISDVMTFDDLRMTLDFYRSEAGLALRSLDPAKMSADGSVSIAALSLEHRRAIGQFQQTGVGRRANQATAQAMARVPTVVSQLFPPYLPRLNAKIRAAGDAFIAAERPK